MPCRDCILSESWNLSYLLPVYFYWFLDDGLTCIVHVVLIKWKLYKCILVCGVNFHFAFLTFCSWASWTRTPSTSWLWWTLIPPKWSCTPVPLTLSPLKRCNRCLVQHAPSPRLRSLMPTAQQKRLSLEPRATLSLPSLSRRNELINDASYPLEINGNDYKKELIWNTEIIWFISLDRTWKELWQFKSEKWLFLCCYLFYCCDKRPFKFKTSCLDDLMFLHVYTNTRSCPPDLSKLTRVLKSWVQELSNGIWHSYIGMSYIVGKLMSGTFRCQC